MMPNTKDNVLWIFVLSCFFFFNYSSGQACSRVNLYPSMPEGEEGTTFELTCALACDWPAASTIWWYKDNDHVFTYDRDLNTNTPLGELIGRVTGHSGGSNHFLNITLDIYDDGDWKCILKASSNVSSNTENLQISVTPKPAQIQIAGDTNPQAGTTITYTCTVDRLKPEFDVRWYKDGEIESGDPPDYNANADGTQHLTITRNILVDTVKDITLKCSLTSGGKKVENTLTVTAFALPKIEKYNPVNTTIDADSQAFELSCTASGTSVSVSWMQNGSALNENKFDIDQITVDEDFDYGQTTGKRSTITWVNTVECVDLNQYIGNYQCKVQNEAGVEDLSPVSQVDVQYQPRKKEVNEKEPIVGEALNITCPCCANPLIYSWEWSVEGKETFPPGIEGQKAEQLYIKSVTQENINYLYQCSATNSKGTVRFGVSLVEDSKVGGLSVGEIVAIVLSIVAIVAVIGVLLVVWKKKKLKADEEVVAYAESGNKRDTNSIPNTTNAHYNNAAPVYSEVKKEKKGKPPTSNRKTPAVYAEVDKSKKKSATSNKEETTGPVYSQVHKPGHRPLPQLKTKTSTSSTSTGPVYSEVNKPKQGRLTPIEAQHKGVGNDYEEAGCIGGKPLPPIKNARHYDNTGQRNEHGGLHYADVDFLRQGNGGTKQSHGTRNPAYEPTEYAQIDHRKSAGIVV